MLQQTRPRESTTPSDPALHLLTLASGFFMSQAIFVAARLGLADLLAGAPRSAGELAAATGTHPHSLARVLRMLANAGLFAVDAEGRFANTPVSDRLRADHSHSVRNYVLVLAEEWMWQSAPGLQRSIEAGEPAFDRVYGKPIYDHMKEHPAAAHVFDEGMTAYSKISADALAAAYPLPQGARIVDVGGGHGHQLEAFLRASPGARGLLFDLPHVIEAARPRLQATDVADRCELVAGDFFESIPERADYYMLRSVVHNWSDDHAVALLKKCRAAMAEGGKVLLVEVVVSPGSTPLFSELLDVQMQLFTLGRERTEDEFRRLYEQAGLRMTRVVRTASFMSVIEGVAA